MKTEQQIICLITPGHICNCPRLIKEADALHKAGYQVHIIATSYMPYLICQDELIVQQNPTWHFYIKHWHKSSFNGLANKFQYGFLKILHRTLSTSAIFPYLLNRNFCWQVRTAIKIKADLYIAHSAGSIVVAKRAAKATNSKFAFDAEDFHTGEDLSPETLNWINDIQKKNLQNAAYISAASPCIANAYQNYLPISQITVLLNVFPLNEKPLSAKRLDEPLRLFWFSQTVGKGRGLEWVFDALQNKRVDEIEFHILGNLRLAESTYFKKLISNYHLPEEMIRFYDPLPEDALLKLATSFDIGLSLETGIPLNRDLCLSNKIFVYLYAGLGIIATDTWAQQEFFNVEGDGTAILPLANPKQLSEILSLLIADPQKVNAMRQFNNELAKKHYHWEKEQLKFLSIVSRCLQEKSS